MMVLPNFHMKAFETDEERAAAAELSYEQRYSMITNLVVPHLKFESAYAHIDSLLGPVQPGFIGGIIGESRVGKSWVSQYFAWKHPPVQTEYGSKYPVAIVAARKDWTAVEFSKQLYDATGSETKPRDTNASVNTSAANRLHDYGVKLLIVDDAHFLWHSKNMVHRLESLLIHISNQRACNILLVGLPSVRDAVYANNQIRLRGDFPHFPLTEYGNGTDEESRYTVFLDGVDKRLPFSKRSWLGRYYAEDFHSWSGGLSGRTMNIVIDAGHAALKDGADCITMDHLHQAAVKRSELGERVTMFREKKEKRGGK